MTLPQELVETSGIVPARHEGFFWTHNDGSSHLFAIDSAGAVVASVPVGPRLRDWEDLAAGACGEGERCLYLADTGDNAEVRPAGSVRIVRILEPDLSPDGVVADSVPLHGDVLPIVYPDGPRDVEALFVLPGERLHLVTKGRNHGISVYRYPLPLRSGEAVTVEEVQRLTGAAQPLASQVTGAGTSPDGRRVAVRTYQSLAFYEPVGDTLRRIADGVVNLRPLEEAQGEAVAITGDDRVILTSEGGFLGEAPSMNILRCAF